MKYSLVFLAIVAVLVVSIEAGKNCKRQARKAKKAGRTPPTCNGKEFTPEQCRDDICYCAKVNNGKQLYSDFEYLKTENYDCSSKLFSFLFYNPV